MTPAQQLQQRSQDELSTILLVGCSGGWTFAVVLAVQHLGQLVHQGHQHVQDQGLVRPARLELQVRVIFFGLRL